MTWEKPYWESTLTLKQAQDYSEDGIAILGNPAMRDLIWPKNADRPLMWVNKGYRPQDPDKFKDRIGWVPSKPTAEYLANDA